MVAQRSWLMVAAWGLGGVLLAVGSFALTRAVVVSETAPGEAVPVLVPWVGDGPFADAEPIQQSPSRSSVFERSTAFPPPRTEVADPDPLRRRAAGEPGGVRERRAGSLDLTGVPEAEPLVDVVLPAEDGQEPVAIADLIADHPDDVELDLPGPVPFDEVDALMTLAPLDDEGRDDADDGAGAGDPLDDPDRLTRLLDPGALIRAFEDLDRDDPLFDRLFGAPAEEEACDGWLDCWDPLAWFSGRNLPFVPNFTDPCADVHAAAEEAPDDPFAQLSVVDCGNGISGTVLAVTGESRLPRVSVSDASRGSQIDVRCAWEDTGGHPILLSSDEPIVGGTGELRQFQLDGTYLTVGEFALPATAEDEVARWRAGDLAGFDHWAARRLHTCLTVAAPRARLQVAVTATLLDGSRVRASRDIHVELGGLRERPPIELTGYGSTGLAVTVPLVSERNETTSDVTVIRADGLDGARDCASFDRLDDAAARRDAIGTAQRYSFHRPGRGTYPVSRRALADPEYPYIRDWDLRQVHLLRIPAGDPHLVCVRTLEVSTFGPDRTIEAQQFVAIAPRQAVDVKIQANGGDFRRAVDPGDIAVVVTHPETNRELTDGIARGCWGNAPRRAFAAGERGRDAGGPTILCQTAGYGDLWPDEVDVRVTVGDVTQLQRIPIDRSRGPRRENFLIPVTAERQICGESIFGSSCGNRNDVGELNLEVEYIARGRGVSDELFVQPTGDYAQRERLDTAALPELARIDTSPRRVPGGIEPASYFRAVSPWGGELVLVPDRDVTVQVVHERVRCRAADLGPGSSRAERVASGHREELEPVDLLSVPAGTVRITADRRSRIPVGSLCPGEPAHLSVVLDDAEGRRTILRLDPLSGEAEERRVDFASVQPVPGLPVDLDLGVRFVYGPDPDAPRILFGYDVRTPVGGFASYLEGSGLTPCVTRTTRLPKQMSGEVGMLATIEAHIWLEYERMPTEQEWDWRQRAHRNGSLSPPCVSTEYLDVRAGWAGRYRHDGPLRDLLDLPSNRGLEVDLMTEHGALVELEVRVTLKPSD